MTYLPVLHTDDQTARFISDLVATARVEVAERDGVIIGFAAVRGSWLEHLNVHPAVPGRRGGQPAHRMGQGDLADGARPLGLPAQHRRPRPLRLPRMARRRPHRRADNDERQPDVHMRWEPTG